MRRLLHAFFIVALAAGALAARARAQTPPSIEEELGAGRYWHVAMRLRRERADRGPPEKVLLLARAEMGWRHWQGVRTLLSGRQWLGEVAGGEGWWLLGRAAEAEERWAQAATSYRAYLAASRGAATGAASVRTSVIRARLARSLLAQDSLASALEVLDRFAADERFLVDQAALEGVRRFADAGDTAAVSALLERVSNASLRQGAWRSQVRARLAAGDTSGAERVLQETVAHAAGTRRAAVRVDLGVLRLARGDTADARAVLMGALDEARGAFRRRAAAALVRLGSSDAALLARLARMAERAVDGRTALRAYDALARRVRADGGSLDPPDRLARARLMGTVRSRRAEAVREFRALAAGTDEEIAARTLEAWAAVRRRQGRTRDVRTIEGWLLERYPGSPQAAELLWRRATSAEESGALEQAVARYRTLIARTPTNRRAGQARMRLGQIELGSGDPRAALRVFEGYLDDFPHGRRWEEASYWAARLSLAAGDSARARARVARVRRESPLSYYAVLGARLLGEDFRVDVPAGEEPFEPGWLAEGLRRLDLLERAGLVDGVDAEIIRLSARARGSVRVTMTLAEELIARGHTIEGINLGWALRRAGRPWDQRLLRIVYPFPYRELVLREAREWGIDPFLLAALIRQESAFDREIVSDAGAVGLMQVLPGTGRGLARVHGPRGFTPATLRAAEINLHLGSAFLVEMTKRFHGELPLVLSAYNAGPTRAHRWMRYRESADPLRFTERIPFAETRGYVKNVRRNVELYQALYHLK